MCLSWVGRCFALIKNLRFILKYLENGELSFFVNRDTIMNNKNNIRIQIINIIINIIITAYIIGTN